MDARFAAWLDDLRSRIGLEEVVSEYVPLKQKGRRFWGCCPFHNEKTPSFSVDTESQMYYCFGCHKGGTVINFVMEMERMDFMDAVRQLAERAHMEVPERTKDPAVPRTTQDERERMYDANREAARFYHEMLWTGEGAAVLNYLYGRGLNDSDIRRFGLGASPASRDGLIKRLTEKGFDMRVMEQAGLIVRRENGVHDMFRNRAMFPIINAQGRVLGFGGRAMGDAQPKYLNTAETPIFNKRRGLYSLNMAAKERDVGHLVLVEGYMDTVSLRKYGVKGVVATLGTALTEEQARLMKRYAPEVWISYDGDSAGQKAALRALDILDAQNLPAKVIDYPDGMDPDDFVKAKGLQGFESLPKHESTSYRMLRAKDGLDLSLQDHMTQYAIKCCGILKAVKDPVIMDNYLRRLVNETGYDRNILLRQIGVGATMATPEVRRPYRREEEPTGELLAERAMISMLAASLIPADMIAPEDFDDATNRALAELLISGHSVGGYIESLDNDAERERALKAVNYSHIPDTREDAVKMAENCHNTIRKARIHRRIEQIKQEIGTASSEKKEKLYKQLMAMTIELED